MTGGAGRRVVMLDLHPRLDGRLLQESRALREEGYEVVVVGAPGESAVDDYRPDELIDAGRGLPARLRRRALGAALRLRGLELSGYEHAFYRRALELEPDVVHVFDLPLLPVGAAVKQATGARLVYDMREFYPEQPRLSPAARERLRALERRHIGSADLRLAVNPLLAGEISKRYGGLRVDVLHLAVDAPADLHERRHDLFRERLGIGLGRRLLLYQGWLSAEESLEQLVESLGRVSAPIDLVFMGYGDFARELQRLAEEHGVAERVHLVPARPRDEFLHWTASADVGLVPYPATRSLNQRLASTYKLYEYIAARLPILTNELPFVRGVVVENGFGVAADLESVEGIGRALDTFPFDRLAEFRQNLAERGEAFSWAAERPKLLELYGRLVSRKG